VQWQAGLFFRGGEHSMTYAIAAAAFIYHTISRLTSFIFPGVPTSHFFNYSTIILRTKLHFKNHMKAGCPTLFLNHPFSLLTPH